MEGTIKYSREEVEEIVLAYHVIMMPSPKKDMQWVATQRTYGGAECVLVEDKTEKLKRDLARYEGAGNKP